MEQITAVMEALQQAGIPARRGFPAERMPYLTAPVTAVCLEQAQEEAVHVAVRIYCPMGMGGAQCEDTAMRVAEILKQLNAQYQIKACEFDGRMGLFTMTVLGRFQLRQAEP